MKFRITPFNFFTAFLICLAVYVFIYGAGITGTRLIHWNKAIGSIFLLFAFVVSFLDLMFRNFFPELKKLWIIQLSFITLVVVILLLVK